jgi:hypothetical protein
MGHFLLKMSPSKQAIDSVTLSRQELDDFRQNFRVGLDWDQYKVDLD